MKAVSLYCALSCQKWFLIECCVRRITGSCHHKGSYRVMNSTGGQMLQRMGSGKQNEKLWKRATPRCKEEEREREGGMRGG